MKKSDHSSLGITTNSNLYPPKVELRLLKIEDKEKFFKALTENWELHFDFVHYWETLAKKDFERYVQIAPDFSKGLHIPKEHVPCTLLFAFNEQDEIIGRTSIRYQLDDHLLQVGGHIGYGVVPSYRKKGYATLILKESLDYVRKHLKGIDRVLLTCDEGNIGSQKTIERNGGILENIIEIQGGKTKMRYWVWL